VSTDENRYVGSRASFVDDEINGVNWTVTITMLRGSNQYVRFVGYYLTIHTYQKYIVLVGSLYRIC